MDKRLLSNEQIKDINGGSEAAEKEEYKDALGGKYWLNESSGELNSAAAEPDAEAAIEHSHRRSNMLEGEIPGNAGSFEHRLGSIGRFKKG